MPSSPWRNYLAPATAPYETRAQSGSRAPRKGETTDSPRAASEYAPRILWRISNHATLDGEGGLLASARWHSQGRRIVYLAESPAGAMIEALVHLEVDPAHPPPNYTLLQVEVPARLAIPILTIEDLADVAATRAAGDGWLRAGASALLRVPSVIAPETWNVLLNPVHGDAARLRVVWKQRQPWDARLVEGLL